MAKRSGILVGTAGVYFVASQLAARGFHAAPTFGNAPSVDLLVASLDGKSSLCIMDNRFSECRGVQSAI